MFPSKTAPERTADFIIHAVSLVGLALASAILISLTATGSDPWLLAAVVVYVLMVLASVGVSFAYHLLPRHDLRLQLRRWDHAAIYTVIAGTFTPLLMKCGTWSAYAILAVIWAFALIGVWFKLVANEIDTRWSLYSYLGLGWFALIALPDFWVGLPGLSTALVGAGGLFYTIGTLFYRRKEMPFRYPIWHFWGTIGGSCFFASIWVAVAL